MQIEVACEAARGTEKPEKLLSLGFFWTRSNLAVSVAADFGRGSGEIERVTSYEAGFVGHHTVRNGHAVPDPLILDERFLAARVRGRGVSVLSSCSHAGVVNAALGALGAFGSEPIVHDLAKRVRPRVAAPGNCTGWRANEVKRGVSTQMAQADITAIAQSLEEAYPATNRALGTTVFSHPASQDEYAVVISI